MKKYLRFSLFSTLITFGSLTILGQEYSLTYKDYPMKATVCDVTYAEGAEVVITSNVPTKLQFKFDGWMYNGQLYAPGAKFIMPAKDVELVAHWTEDPVTNPKQDNNSAVEKVSISNTHRAQKVVRDGQIYVLRDGVLYDLLGKQVR